ncbi:hypothetical protein HH1059_23950 [Halorhodospira halochloris]|uniref:Secreted protein n=1 Tax=Halorhodospira halochloris TaxID=1052 RepID=A0A2Z6F000_HALHR|nr:hypothetical protein [Halorhodospira halochloris]MBK1651023.1 hypothetical protein [Halorhodospira halochloris]MCG5547365.1 hypothetical protein [Halorhodospira halochloris]BBE11173.1 hypothetical protein HH1059_23950 [Halorhodospira halochloris]
MPYKMLFAMLLGLLISAGMAGCAGQEQEPAEPGTEPAPEGEDPWGQPEPQQEEDPFGGGGEQW